MDKKKYRGIDLVVFQIEEMMSLSACKKNDLQVLIVFMGFGVTFIYIEFCYFNGSQRTGFINNRDVFFHNHCQWIPSKVINEFCFGQGCYGVHSWQANCLYLFIVFPVKCVEAGSLPG
ncbi:hypothetical protein [Sinomicrobium soli]|uniref:hypothetical protein n=1 Tax=Sinomicrobium sp. N-1-3-6 TaxID=2219864 RepID=UPI001F1CBDFD|nr:hypothetical protein [Sinomicrobium sp. N-1-3-6]